MKISETKNKVIPEKNISGSLFFQPKLTIDQPNDEYEQEADAVADKVMRTSANNNAFFKPAIQRKCAYCEAEEKQNLQRKEINSEATIPENKMDHYVDSLSNGGQSLPKQTRSFFESRMGHDFSNVKLHTDAVAAKSAESVNALAYTSGNNIVFNSGQYSPDTANGKQLLAHELTHVVQQNSTIQTKEIQRTCSDGRCEGCAGGQKDFWITFYFRRRATTQTMQTIRNEINNTKKILEKCCLTLKADFNWTLLPGGGTFNFIDTTDPAQWHYSTDASNLGTGNVFAGSRGVPILVVDDVPQSGGGVTVDTRFDANYTGRTYAVLGVNQTSTPNTGCTHLAHELWHVGSGIVGHDPAHGTLASCTGDSVSPEYCSGLRAMVGA